MHLYSPCAQSEYKGVRNGAESASYLSVQLSMYPMWRKEKMQKYSSRRLARRSARTRDDAPNRQLHRHLLAILLAFSDPLRATLSSPVPCAGILLPHPLRANPFSLPRHCAQKSIHGARKSLHNPARVLDSLDSVPAREILVAAGDEPPEARDGPATTPDWICSDGIRGIRPCFCYSSGYA